jgi:hypothetical protein
MTNPTPHGQVPDAYDHGPQAETVEEAARDVGKWLNERPNRPLDLRHVAMLTHHALRTAHVQKLAEIEHVAGDVSKNGAELNTSTQQPAPAAGVTVEQVEDAIGLQSTAWDTIGAEKIVEAVLRLTNGQAPATQQAGEVRRAELVPGVMHCAKCKFQLNRVTLCVSDGNAYAGNNKTEPCPNGCGPLWPVTWEQEAKNCWKALEEMHERLMAAAAPQPSPTPQADSQPAPDAWLVTGIYTKQAFPMHCSAMAFLNGLLSSDPDGGYKIVPLFIHQQTTAGACGCEEPPTNPGDTESGPEGEWYCETHPGQLMGHAGCGGAGIPACGRIPCLMNQLRLTKQQVRETGRMRDEMAAMAHRAARAPAGSVMEDAARWQMAVLVGNEVLMHPDKRSNPAAVKAYMDAVHSGLDFTGAVDAARKQGGA